MKTKNFSVCFDVQGTLFEDDRVCEPVFALLKAFLDLGADVYIWSGGGLKTAEKAAERLGLKGSVLCIEKGSINPDLTVDDTRVSFGRVNMKVQRSFE
jgi:hydroxymethylpyrimidine pyrophosphatase-like HAD family hydrolase